MTRAPAAPAIGTKLHAMYGRRLTEANYEDMLRARSVGEIAGYLKSDTRFAASLGNMQEASIHRGQLETLLERSLFDEVARLRKYDRGGRIFGLYEAKQELSLITSCIGFLREGRQDRFLESVPGYLIGRLRLNIDAMVNVHDAGQLAQILSHTIYGKAFRHMLIESGGALPPVSVCAARLGECYFLTALHEVDSAYRGKERDALRSLLLAQVEVTNLTVAFRMKKYFGADTEEIRRNLISIYHAVKRREIEYLLMAPSAEEFEQRLMATHAGRMLRSEDFSFIEYSTDRRRLMLSHRAFQFTTSPAVAFVAFLTMREIELANVLTIVEGVRYHVQPDEIRKLLVLL